MKRIKIKGKNKSLHSCLECGSKLSFNEYIYGREKCTSCRVKNFDTIDRQYVELDGSNNVDMILINKREKR